MIERSVFRRGRVDEIRQLFAGLYNRHRIDKTVEVGGTLELLGSTFVASEPTIFGAVNEDYVKREIEWYESGSRYVEDIPGGPPAIWRQVADGTGKINSNYGWAMFSRENGDQYASVLSQLKSQRGYGRRGTAIYTRPEMHAEWNHNGMSDFMCTSAVNYFERKGELHAVVQMRSNDAIFGYRNDLAWQKHVLAMLAADLEVKAGDIVWQAASLHIYARHYHLIDHFRRTGEYDVPVTADA